MLEVEGIQELLSLVIGVFDQLEIQYFIIGAVARNIWYANNEESSSGTQDVDFAVCIPNEEKYSELKLTLVKTYGFTESSDNAFCLISPDSIQVDFLPFGEIVSNGQVNIEGFGLTKISLDGFEEVFQEGVKSVDIEGKKFYTCDIPSVVMLKLIAFDDRPDRRIKDIEDIAEICKSFPYFEQEFVWENHSDLYGDKEHNEVALVALGRAMRKIIGVNEILLKRLNLILSKGINMESDLLEHYIKDKESQTIEQVKEEVNWILSGLNDVM